MCLGLSKGGMDVYLAAYIYIYYFAVLVGAGILICSSGGRVAGWLRSS